MLSTYRSESMVFLCVLGPARPAKGWLACGHVNIGRVDGGERREKEPGRAGGPPSM